MSGYKITRTISDHEITEIYNYVEKELAVIFYRLLKMRPGCVEQNMFFYLVSGL